MTRIVILANSMQPGGRCLAGIDLDTGKWIRPIHETRHAIPEAECIVSGKMLSVGDILECKLAQPADIVEFQCENQVVSDWNWKIVGQVEMDKLEKFVEDTSPILHSSDEPVNASILKDKDPSEWKSLQLVKPKNLTFRWNPKKYGRWLADFQDAHDNNYSLSVTDPVITPRLKRNRGVISEECLLTVSLPNPWKPDPNPHNIPLACYRVIAAVIQLP